MSDTTEVAAEDMVTQPPAETSAEDDSPQPPDDNEPAPKNREERFRKQLRVAEAERDALSDRLTRMQRAEVERIASTHLTDGADFWRDGTELAHVLTDTGDINPDKVSELVASLVDSHPHWKRAAVPAGPPASTVTGNDTIGDGQPARTWSGLLQGKIDK